MAKMNRFERWTVNRSTESRARRVLAGLGSRLELTPSDRVLELGSGRGGLLALLQERFRPGRLVGTDVDEAQVASAQEFLTGRWRELPPSVELRTADALALPFPDGSFECVFAMMMLHHVETRFSEYERRPQALREIRRVLAPGGTFVYSDQFRRREIRDTLGELGFVREFLRSRWRHDLGMYRAPGSRRTDPSGPAIPPVLLP